MNSDIIRGHLDMIILHFLVTEDLYGYKLSKLISTRTNGMYEIKETSLYSALRRLEETNIVESYITKDEDTNRSRRMYRITTKGITWYEELCSEWNQTKFLLDLFVGGIKHDN